MLYNYAIPSIYIYIYTHTHICIYNIDYDVLLYDILGPGPGARKARVKPSDSGSPTRSEGQGRIYQIHIAVNKHSRVFSVCCIS